MIAVEQNERDYIQLDSRRFFSRLLCGGSEIDGIIRSWVLHKGSCGGSSFQPQSIFSNYADVTIDYCASNLAGKKIDIQIGYELNGEKYWHTIASLYASKPKKKGNKTTVQCLGSISAKLGKKFSGGTYTTVSSLLERISEVAGCTITLDDGLEDVNIPEADLSEYLYREVLGLVAGLYFGYATETVDGTIVIKSYKTTDGTITAYPARMKADPDFYDNTAVVGIQVIGSNDTEFLVGDLQNCTLTNPLMTTEIFTKYVNNYLNFTYQPYDMELTLGDFTLEPWDVIEIEDREGVTHSLRPMSIKHTFDGGLKTTVSSPTTDSGEDYSRGETQKMASTAYNAVVSGNVGTGGSSEGTGSGGEVSVFNVYGSHVTSGIGWVDSGGGQAFMSLNFSIPSTSEGYGVFSGSLSFGTTKDLSPYAYTAKTLYENLAVPFFYYNGTQHYSAGGLSIAVTVNIANKTYEVNYSYSNNYMLTELGDIAVYNAETETYESAVGGTFQINLSWLLNNV